MRDDEGDIKFDMVETSATIQDSKIDFRSLVSVKDYFMNVYAKMDELSSKYTR